MRPKSTLDPSEGVHVDRTYRRCDLVALIPGVHDEFIKFLVDLYGLLPLGGRQHVYFGRNIIESLIRHARDERVKPERRRLTRVELRAAKWQARRKAGAV
jgi:hypothetical protein